MRVAGVDVVLRDVQLVGRDHPVAAHHQRAADERVVEVGCVARWPEVAQDRLRAHRLAVRLEFARFLARPHDDEDADEREDGEAHHPRLEDARCAVREERSADDRAERLADGDAGAVEAGDRAAHLVGDAVGHDGDVRREHHVVAHLCEAPQRHDERLGARERDRPDAQAGDEAAEHDPRRALAEARTRLVGERAEDDVRYEGDERADRVDEAEHEHLAAGVDLLEHARQDDGAQRDPRDRAGDRGHRETDAEPHDLRLRRTVAVGRDHRIAHVHERGVLVRHRRVDGGERGHAGAGDLRIGGELDALRLLIIDASLGGASLRHRRSDA